MLHELDTWLEKQLGVNPAPQTAKEVNQRSNPEYMHLHYRLMDIRRFLNGKRSMPEGATPEKLRQEYREKLQLRKMQPRNLPRKVTYYTRYADDFIVILCNTSKSEALHMKAIIAEWMQTNLGLTLNQDKTHVTYWQEKFRFLGYELEGRPNPNGTGWLHLNTPKESVRNVVSKVQQATRYPQAPEYDVFQNVNAIALGWINYYRYAHNLNVTGGKLSMIIYWQVVHYLSKRHKRSIVKTMKEHYARDPKTGCLGLYVPIPGKPQSKENCCFIWHKTPPRLQLNANQVYSVEDSQAYINTNWAKGRSQQKKMETQANAGKRCERCGAEGVMLYVHHPNRLEKAKRVDKGMAHVAQSGIMQTTILLCHTCHMIYHHHQTIP